MKQEILANCTPDETRVAIRQDGRLSELLIERAHLGAAKVVGNIYKGRVENVLPGISSAFVNIGFDKNAYLYISDVIALHGREHSRHIEKLLKRNEDIMIQVDKEAIGTKGMKISMNVSFPGRYMILMPFSKRSGISRQIEARSERERLREIVESLHPPGGVIIRTEAEGAEERELRREMKYLVHQWELTNKKLGSMPAPSLLRKDLGLTFQVARDILSEDTEIFMVDLRSEYEDLKSFVGMVSPELVNRIRYYDGKTSIFQAFNVERELAQIRSPRIDLPSGGYIIVQEAESLCAIDVNTGKFTGRKSQEDTVTVTNLEAAQEVARQIRLRNIGGIIVIDFIDMRRRENQQRVMEALQRATRRDRAKIKILPITRLGLIEMTRERRRESLLSLLSEACHECSGSGMVLSRESLYIKVHKEILDLTQGRPGGNLRLLLAPEVSEFFSTRKERMEKQLKRPIELQADPTQSWEDYQIILEE